MVFGTDRQRLNPESEELQGKRVLVVGYRNAITDVLERLGIPYAVWHDRPIKRTIRCLKMCTHPFDATASDFRAFAAEEFGELGPFTDVIAGTEASVYPASVCRRVLGARKSKDSTVLRCSDKHHMKMMMKRHNIPLTDYIVRSEVTSFDEVFDQLGPKVVVKERRNSGGRGVSIAHSVEELESRKGRGLIYERFVDANELSIESFIREYEIKFTSTTNYLVKTHANIVPANLPASVLAKAQQLNRQVISALNLDWGLTHAEFYWNDESVLFGEIALRPPGGYIMDCITLAHGFDAWEAFVVNELDLPFSFPDQCKQTAGVAMLHAGEGKINSISGVDEARRLDSSVRFKLLVKPGDLVSPRVGVSDLSGYGLFLSDCENKAAKDVLACLQMVQFEHEAS